MPAREFDWLLIALSLIAVVYIGFVALVQTDMKKLIAYSSIAHMGFVTLGSFLVYDIVASTGAVQGAGMGIDGAMVQMVSHGLISGALFLCVGVMYDRVHSREISAYGGVINTMPKFAAFMVLFALANAGLPGTSGFVGEFLVIIAAFKANFWYAFLAGVTLILGAAYTLWLVKRVIFGEVANHHVAELQDLNCREFIILGVLAVGVLVVGLWPAPLLEVMQATVQHLVQQIAASKLPPMNSEITVTDTTLGEPAAGAAGDLSHGRHLRAADGRRVLRRQAPRPRAHAHAAHPGGRRRRHRDVRQRHRSARCCSATATWPIRSRCCSKLFGFMTIAVALLYSRDYLERRGMMRGEYYVLALTALLGIFVMVSANSLLTVYIGVELMSLSLYAMVAFDRDIRHRRRIGHEVLRARRHRLGHAALWHVADLRPDRHAHARRSRRDGHGRAEPRRDPRPRVPRGRGRVQVRRRAVPHVGARRLHRRAHRA